MKETFDKILLVLLTPFKKLSEGYYRLFLAGWFLGPLIVSILFYFTTSVFGDSRDWNDADEISTTLFFILLIAYYPLARIILWVWMGFNNTMEKDQELANIFPDSFLQDSSTNDLFLPLKTLYQKHTFEKMSMLRYNGSKPYITMLLGNKALNVSFDEHSCEFILKRYEVKEQIVFLLKYAIVKFTLSIEDETRNVIAIKGIKIILNTEEQILEIVEKNMSAKYGQDFIGATLSLFKSNYQDVPATT